MPSSVEGSNEFPAKQSSRRDEQHNQSLQHQNKILGDMFREDVHEHSTSVKRAEKQRRHENPCRMVAARKRDSDSRKTDTVRKPLIASTLLPPKEPPGLFRRATFCELLQDQSGAPARRVPRYSGR
jgi:hypothetical protein